MPGTVLTTASTVQCPHGGAAILTTANARVASDAPILLESDVHAVVGCPFTVGLKYSPCVRIEWSAGAGSVTVDGDAVLVTSSVGKCINPEGVTQGLALISATHPASAR